jgi:hypothetical protein
MPETEAGMSFPVRRVGSAWLRVGYSLRRERGGARSQDGVGLEGGLEIWGRGIFTLGGELGFHDLGRYSRDTFRGGLLARISTSRGMWRLHSSAGGGFYTSAVAGFNGGGGVAYALPGPFRIGAEFRYHEVIASSSDFLTLTVGADYTWK